MAECKHGASLWSIRSRGPVCQCGAGSLELIRAYRSAREKLINAELREYRLREAGDIPIAIIKKKFDLNSNALVVMKLDEFMEWFGG